MTTEMMMEKVEAQRDLIMRVLQTIWAHPETGYKEYDTSAFALEEFRKLGYEPVRPEGLTGFYADVYTGRPGPKFAVMAELDSIICADHPESDPETGAVHACGHCAQMAGMLGLAAVLKEPGILEGLSGSIRLMVVPAEELLELGYREGLRQQGRIHYYGGKVEFLYRGMFDGVDMAMMIHTMASNGPLFMLVPGANGCLLKNITFKGVAAHAGGSPHEGINALYAASLSMQATNALRETWQEKDYIRYHPIVTEGGQMVNAIPDTVRMESYVRGASWEAIQRENKKINRALAASAAAIGAQVILQDRPGYSPLHNDQHMAKYCKEALLEVWDEADIADTDHWDTGCTDVGDISAVMPAIQIYAAGAVGHAHGADYYITDPEKACVNSTKALLLTIVNYMKDDAAKAKDIIEHYVPVFDSFADYFTAMDAMCMDQEGVVYHENGDITLAYTKNEKI